MYCFPCSISHELQLWLAQLPGKHAAPAVLSGSADVVLR